MSHSASSFSESQRYSSTSEPELGLGMVTETAKGRVQLYFPLSGETRMYAMDSAPLRRVAFKIGDAIVDRLGRSLTVESVSENGDLLVYAGQGKVISEADLGIVSVNHGPEDRLLMGDVDSPALFALRRRTLVYDHARRISPVNGFLGGRIDLIPHQLYIAHEVSERYAPRVLLSDEVGLGKTIEACLILHRLRSLGRISRALILVPDSLVHQWFVELLRRFNMWFNIFDERRCASAEKGAPDGNPFLDDQWIICSTDFLAKSPKRAAQALSAGWEMLVVDEAHHLEWSVNQASLAYLVVEALSKATNGLLLLTATPEQLGQESHFARLRLLDPNRYSDFAEFQNEAIHQQNTATIAGKIAGNQDLESSELQLLVSLFGESRVKELQKKEDSVRELFLEDLLDRHGPGRVIFRNKRAAMVGFPRRIVHLVPLKATSDETFVQESLSEEGAEKQGGASNDVPHSAEEIAEFTHQTENDLRVEWLVDCMKRLRPAKVLLICSSKEKVLALEAELNLRVKFKLGVFHEDLTLVQRDRAAAWFSEADGARLLLCSEIGSEGRNFQFAHHLILFDLPLKPDLLEQRIGRLDRIGQTEDIKIHVPYIAGSGEEVLARWYHEGLNAFEKNLEGGNQMAEMFGERLRMLIESQPSADEKLPLNELIGETARSHNALKANLAAGRDQLLEMNSFRPAIAKELIAKIQAEDLNSDLESFMMSVFERFGVDVEDLAPRTYLLHGFQGNAAAFPGLPDDGLSVTFDRKRALSREDIGFLSWDHPMVTGAMDMVLGSGTGSASFGILKRPGAPAIFLELLFVLETAGTAYRGVDRFLPNTPIRVVVDHHGADVTIHFPEGEWGAHLRPGEIDQWIDNEEFVEGLLPKMLANASQFAEAQAAMEIQQGLSRMLVTLDHEIDRLKALAAVNSHIRPEEIEIAELERTGLSNRISNARIRLDAILLIQRGAFSAEW
jgi:ATP-dependent helicase HepA